MRRWPFALLALLLAGCSGPSYPPSSAPVPAEPQGPEPLLLASCAFGDARVHLPADATPFPDGLRPAQAAGSGFRFLRLVALDCSGATALLGGVDVESDTHGPATWLLGAISAHPDLEAWFGGLPAMDVASRAVSVRLDDSRPVRTFSAGFGGATVDGEGLRPAEPWTPGTFLVADGRGVAGTVGMASEPAAQPTSMVARLSTLEALPGPMTAGRLSTLDLTWSPAESPNP